MITNNSALLNVMSKSLDAYYLRNEVISNNIANVDTPNYKRKDVKFEEFLKAELDNANRTSNIGNSNRTSTSGINGIRPEIYEQETDSMYRIDGCNVDIDNEMSELVKNQMRYSVVLSQVNKQFTAMRTAMGR